MQTQLVKVPSPPSSPSSSLSSLSQELPSCYYFLAPSSRADSSCKPLNTYNSSFVRKRPATVYEADQLPAELDYMEEAAAQNKRCCTYAVVSRPDGCNGSKEESSYCVLLDELSSADDIPDPILFNDNAVSGQSWGGAAVGADGESDLDNMLELLLADSTALSCPSGTSTVVDHSVREWEYCKEEGGKAVLLQPATNGRDGGGAFMGNPASEEVLNGAAVMELNTSNWCGGSEQSMENISLSCTASAQHQQKWAGPTLTEVESALGLPPATTSAAADSTIPTFIFSSSFLRAPLSTAYPSYPLNNILHNASNIIASPSAAPKEELLEEDDEMCTWRKVMQKRSHMEPQYTVKIRCEEEAVNDGYRWRKYGQKSIKNSPFPRSYYRCSSGKCSVKKRVERSSEDAGLLLVSYEGIHLHHRPQSMTSLLNATTSSTTAPTSLIHAGTTFSPRRTSSQHSCQHANSSPPPSTVRTTPHHIVSCSTAAAPISPLPDYSH